MKTVAKIVLGLFIFISLNSTAQVHVSSINEGKIFVGPENVAEVFSDVESHYLNEI